MNSQEVTLDAPNEFAAPARNSDEPPPLGWEGRVFGGLVLAAFVLYGVGSSTADQVSGLTLVLLNSVAVGLIGLIGFRLLRRSEPQVASSYLIARVVEALLLGGGVLLAERLDVGGADNTGYLLGMVALGVGSIPFCRSLGRNRWLPRPLATWGAAGYAALAAGAFLELATGWAVSIVFAAPGGLFELVLGLYLVRYGFRRLD